MGKILGGLRGAVAAVGVILTLLYLARQIHQNIYRRGFDGLGNRSIEYLKKRFCTIERGA